MRGPDHGRRGGCLGGVLQDRLSGQGGVPVHPRQGLAAGHLPGEAEDCQGGRASPGARRLGQGQALLRQGVPGRDRQRGAQHRRRQGRRQGGVREGHHGVAELGGLGAPRLLRSRLLQRRGAHPDEHGPDEAWGLQVQGHGRRHLLPGVQRLLGALPGLRRRRPATHFLPRDQPEQVRGGDREGTGRLRQREELRGAEPHSLQGFRHRSRPLRRGPEEDRDMELGAGRARGRRVRPSGRDPPCASMPMTTPLLPP
mmetsp:Transcript_34697/g.107849  ORF Transcript_34697/g.107849 Transcript_34697/m.107849 type:complete len:255 (+) Transcript_34697:3086-3850(+)